MREPYLKSIKKQQLAQVFTHTNNKSLHENDIEVLSFKTFSEI
jgi:hypothetical protein